MLKVPDSIIRLFEMEAGLNPNALGTEAALLAVLERQARKWKAASLEEYGALLTRSEEVRQELLSEVVVPETFLFRYPESFEALARCARNRLEGAPPSRRLRILSLPCASGEEVYSIAIALRRAGVSAQRFSVEGVDLNPAAVEQARAGIYQAHSFRSLDPSIRDNYFSPEGGGYAVREFLRENVSFQVGDLFRMETPGDAGVYDVIFCRNLIIYLTGRARLGAFRRFERWLTGDGLLFLAPAEVPAAAAAGWQLQAFPGAFVCRRAGMPQGSWPDPAAVGGEPQRPQRLRDPSKGTAALEPAAPGSNGPAMSKSRIQELADQGRLAEAATAATELLRGDNAPDPELLFLAGVIQDALGNPDEAEGLFRKALYLAPKHVGALLHLALLKERAGRADLAHRLRRRVAV